MVDRTYHRIGRGAIVDDLLILKAKGTYATVNTTVTVGAIGQTPFVGENPIGTDKYVDVGNGHVRGDVVYNVYSVPTATLATQHYVMRLQGGKNTSFSTLVDLCCFELGAASALSGGIDLQAGRYIIPFTNCIDGVTYRYIRHAISTRGGTATIQYECYLSKLGHVG